MHVLLATVLHSVRTGDKHCDLVQGRGSAVHLCVAMATSTTLNEG